ncbi:hypothetical protein ACFQS6_08500 [Xanthomonas populi]
MQCGFEVCRSNAWIAQQLGRHPSSIGRARNAHGGV